MDCNNMIETAKSYISAESLGATSVLATIISIFLWKFLKQTNKASNTAKDKKPEIKKDEKPIPMDPKTKLENVALRYENEFKQRILTIAELFGPEDEKDIYERNYCNEMLLKLLIELDGVDLSDIADEERKILRERRKEIIRFIQKDLVRLDSLK